MNPTLIQILADLESRGIDPIDLIAALLVQEAKPEDEDLVETLKSDCDDCAEDLGLTIYRSAIKMAKS